MPSHTDSTGREGNYVINEIYISESFGPLSIEVERFLSLTDQLVRTNWVTFLTKRGTWW